MRSNCVEMGEEEEEEEDVDDDEKSWGQNGKSCLVLRVSPFSFARMSRYHNFCPGVVYLVPEFFHVWSFVHL